MSAEGLPELKISFDTREEFKAEWEKDIVKGGLFLQADPPPELRQRVTVIVEVLDARKGFRLSGEVVHSSPQGVGVQLDPLHEEVIKAAEKIMSGEETGAFEAKPESEKGESEGSVYQQIQNLSRHEKLALARKGGMSERGILMRDKDPNVVMAVLQNPRITLSEVIQLSKSKSVSLDIIKMIVRKAEWIAVEDVKLGIVLHPKTPLPTALSLLKTLSERNLRMIAKRPLKAQIKRAALKMVITK